MGHSCYKKEFVGVGIEVGEIGDLGQALKLYYSLRYLLLGLKGIVIEVLSANSEIKTARHRYFIFYLLGGHTFHLSELLSPLLLSGNYNNIASES